MIEAPASIADVHRVFGCIEPADRDAAIDAFRDALGRVGQRRERLAAAWLPSPFAAARLLVRSGVSDLARPDALNVRLLHELDVITREVGSIPVLTRAGSMLRRWIARRLRDANDGSQQPAAMWGQFHADRLAAVTWLDPRSAPLAVDDPSLQLTRACWRAAQCTGPWWALGDQVIASERPTHLLRDLDGRLHADGAAAVTWADGHALHAWHGIVVPPWVTLTPASDIAMPNIENQHNIEVRRVLIERVGYERYMRRLGKLVHEDECGRLWQGPTGPWQSARDVVWVVEVVNATPEPDGTRRRYWLRVPPSMRRAREAVAWTFRMSAAEYRPQRET